ncbi:MAG: 30S ribosomal protein S4 [Flavobacteriales bacterium]|nr:30S ribosomal protein S4 [Flavobacteriales bacterium]
MAKYIGPKTRIARKFGEPIYGPDKILEKKAYPPGQHGNKRRRGKKSEYAVQLMEKQKAKYTYGILERQFSNLFKKASRKRGITGVLLLQLCESRLDNTVYRMGLAPTRAGARQLVGHKHIMVNDQLVNISSFTLKAGDRIAVREQSKSNESIHSSLAENPNVYPWLEWDLTSLSGVFLNVPARDEIPEPIKEQLIVELYSK